VRPQRPWRSSRRVIARREAHDVRVWLAP
jgi:hypothetical protein